MLHISLKIFNCQPSIDKIEMIMISSLVPMIINFTDVVNTTPVKSIGGSKEMRLQL